MDGNGYFMFFGGESWFMNVLGNRFLFFNIGSLVWYKVGFFRVKKSYYISNIFIYNI